MNRTRELIEALQTDAPEAEPEDRVLEDTEVATVPIPADPRVVEQKILWGTMGFEAPPAGVPVIVWFRPNPGEPAQPALVRFEYGTDALGTRFLAAARIIGDARTMDPKQIVSWAAMPAPPAVREDKAQTYGHGRVPDGVDLEKKANDSLRFHDALRGSSWAKP